MNIRTVYNALLAGCLLISSVAFATSQATEKMETLYAGTSATHAFILIGGIYDSYHYFDAWVDALESPNNLVVGWSHDHQGMSMVDAAKELSTQIAELHQQGVTDITLIAHSMGGLVAKGAVDELANAGLATEFRHIDLLTFGTPWGGFALADLAIYSPGSATISKLIRYPMGPDIGPSSAYMQSLSQPMPSNGALRIYVGSKDDTARPAAASTKARWQAIVAVANSVSELPGLGHDDYNTEKVSEVFAPAPDLRRMSQNTP